jgi:hypothetical protein
MQSCFSFGLCVASGREERSSLLGPPSGSIDHVRRCHTRVLCRRAPVNPCRGNRRPLVVRPVGSGVAVMPMTHVCSMGAGARQPCVWDLCAIGRLADGGITALSSYLSSHIPPSHEFFSRCVCIRCRSTPKESSGIGSTGRKRPKGPQPCQSHCACIDAKLIGRTEQPVIPSGPNAEMNLSNVQVPGEKQRLTEARYAVRVLSRRFERQVPRESYSRMPFVLKTQIKFNI